MQTATHRTGVGHFLRSALYPALDRCFTSGTDGLLLVIILIASFGIRWHFLGQPMRADESSTFILYVDRGLTDALTYLSPNNHVLHTLLVKLSTTAFGTQPLAIRLPALLCGLLVIVLAYCVARQNGADGILSALVAGFSPYLILYSTNARGYTLLVCLTLLLTLIGPLFARNPSRGASTAFAIVGALGMFTMPTMAFPLAGVFLWVAYLGLCAGHPLAHYLVRDVGTCALKTLTITVLFYTPVFWFSGYRAVISNEFVTSQDLHSFATNLRWHFEATLVQFSRDWPKAILVPCVATFVYGLFRGTKDARCHTTSMMVCMLIGGGALLLANHRIPFERTWIYLIPLVAIIADVGLTAILRVINFGNRRILLIGGVMATLTIPFMLANENAILNNNDTGVYKDGPKVGKVIAAAMTAGDGIFIPCCESYSLFYYLRYFGAPFYVFEKVSREGNTYYIVPRGHQLKDLGSSVPAHEPWLNVGDTSIYRVEPVLSR